MYECLLALAKEESLSAIPFLCEIGLLGREVPKGPVLEGSTCFLFSPLFIRPFGL